jgi:hypothetical protein
MRNVRSKSDLGTVIFIAVLSGEGLIRLPDASIISLKQVVFPMSLTECREALFCNSWKSDMSSYDVPDEHCIRICARVAICSEVVTFNRLYKSFINGVHKIKLPVELDSVLHSLGTSPAQIPWAFRSVRWLDLLRVMPSSNLDGAAPVLAVSLE